MIRTINRCILASLAVIPLKWVPAVEGPGGIIDIRSLMWGTVLGLVLVYLLLKSR